LSDAPGISRQSIYCLRAFAIHTGLPSFETFSEQDRQEALRRFKVLKPHLEDGALLSDVAARHARQNGGHMTKRDGAKEHASGLVV
jgi:hypothetical protein